MEKWRERKEALPEYEKASPGRLAMIDLPLWSVQLSVRFGQMVELRRSVRSIYLPSSLVILKL